MDEKLKCPHKRIDHNGECLDCDEPVWVDQTMTHPRAMQALEAVEEVDAFLDQQTYDDKCRLEFNYPDDCEFCVNIPAKYLRLLSNAAKNLRSALQHNERPDEIDVGNDLGNFPCPDCGAGSERLCETCYIRRKQPDYNGEEISLEDAFEKFEHYKFTHKHDEVWVRRLYVAAKLFAATGRIVKSGETDV